MIEVKIDNYKSNQIFYSKLIPAVIILSFLITPLLGQINDQMSIKDFNFIKTYLHEFGKSNKKNFLSDFTSIFRESWQYYDFLPKSADESKLKEDLIYINENWTEKQKQVYLVYTYERYQTAAKKSLFSGLDDLSESQKQVVNKSAFIEMAKSHNGFGSIGDYFENIINMEVKSSLGQLNLDWLFTIGKHRTDIDKLFVTRLIPTSSIYHFGKVYWGIVREEDPNLTDSESFFIKSNLNAVKANDLLYSGKTEMRDLFPSLENEDVETLYNELFFHSKIKRPIYEINYPANKFGGISLSSKSFEFRYFSSTNGDNTNLDHCVYKFNGNFHQFINDSSHGVISEDISRLWATLPKHKFWVNLNPSEPDRILDKDLMNTLSGWILATADMKMKKDLAWMLFPDSSLGMKYWDSIYNLIQYKSQTEKHEWAIPLSFRVWLVPGKIKVYANSDEIYIVSAEWDALLEKDYQKKSKSQFKGLSKNEMDIVQRYSEKFLKEKALPKLKYMINTSDGYGKLRELLYGAVIAEWNNYYQKQYVNKSHYYQLSDNAVSDVFINYLKSIENGEYNFTRQSERQEGNMIISTTRTYFNGGIDLMKLSFEDFEHISLEELKHINPDIFKILAKALYLPLGIKHNNDYWIGKSFRSKTN